MRSSWAVAAALATLLMVPVVLVVPLGASTGGEPVTTTNIATTVDTNASVYAAFDLKFTSVGVNNTTVAQTYFRYWRDGDWEPATWAVAVNDTCQQAASLNATHHFAIVENEVRGAAVADGGPRACAANAPTSNLTPGQYYVRYFSVDVSGNVENAKFEQFNVGWVVALQPGLNAVGASWLTGQSSGVSYAFANVSAALAAVWAKNGTGWDLYNPAAPGASTLVTIQLYQPVYVTVSDAVNLYVPYQRPPTSGNLVMTPGWNMVALPNIVGPTPVADALDGVVYNAAWTYNGTAGWALYNPQNPLASGTLNVDPLYPVFVYVATTQVLRW